MLQAGGPLFKEAGPFSVWDFLSVSIGIKVSYLKISGFKDMIASSAVVAKSSCTYRSPKIWTQDLAMVL